MPLYEYRSTKCGVDFELMRRMGEANEPALCPKCGGKAEKLLSVFGSKVGFYVSSPAKPAFRQPPESGVDKS